MSKQDEYVAKMKKQLDEWNGDLKQLQAKADEAKGDAKARYREEIKKLQDQKQAASAKLDEIKDASQDKWDKLVAEFEKLGDAFKHSYNYFKSQL